MNQYFIYAGRIYQHPNQNNKVIDALVLSTTTGICIGLIGYIGYKIIQPLLSQDKVASSFLKEGKSLLTIHSIEHSVGEKDKLKVQLKELSQAFAVDNLLGHSPTHKREVVHLDDLTWHAFQLFKPYEKEKSFEMLYQILSYVEQNVKNNRHQSGLTLVDTVRSSSLIICKSIQQVIHEIKNQSVTQKQSRRRRSSQSLSLKAELLLNVRTFRSAYRQLDNETVLWSSFGENEHESVIVQQFRNLISQIELYVGLSMLILECLQIKGCVTIVLEHAKINDRETAMVLSDKVEKLLGISQELLGMSVDADEIPFDTQLLALQESINALYKEKESMFQSIDTGTSRLELPVVEIKESIRRLHGLVIYLQVGFSIRSVQAHAIALYLNDKDKTTCEHAKSINETASKLAIDLFSKSPLNAPSQDSRDRSQSAESIDGVFGSGDAEENLALANRTLRCLIRVSHFSVHDNEWKHLCKSLNTIVLCICQHRDENLSQMDDQYSLLKPASILAYAHRLSAQCQTWILHVAKLNSYKMDKRILLDVDVDSCETDADLLLVGQDQAMSYVQLLLEPGFIHQTCTVSSAAMGILKLSNKHPGVIATIKKHIVDAVSKNKEGLSIGVATCRNDGTKVVASCASPRCADDDILVSFSLDQDAKQFVFVRKSLSNATQKQIFKALTNLNIASIELQGSKQFTKEQKGHEILSEAQYFAGDVSTQSKKKLVDWAHAGHFNIPFSGGHLDVKVLDLSTLNCVDALDWKSNDVFFCVLHLIRTSKLIVLARPGLPVIAADKVKSSLESYFS